MRATVEKELAETPSTLDTVVDGRPVEVVDLTHSDTRRFVRFVDETEARPTRRDEAASAIFAEAEAKGRGQDEWVASQQTVLEKRMDRAIWEAFRTADFDPLLSLLDQGASAAYVREKGGHETALMAAAYHGHDAACRALIVKGADAAARDRFGNTAAKLARKNRHNTLAFLIEGISEETSHKTVAKRRTTSEDSTGTNSPALRRSPKRRRKGDDAHPRTMPTPMDVDAVAGDTLLSSSNLADDDIALQPQLLREDDISTQAALDSSSDAPALDNMVADD